MSARRLSDASTRDEQNAKTPLASPCIGLCRPDAASGLCLGCARTRPEIAAWRQGDTPWRRAVWDSLPERFARLGIVCRQLPWGRDGIRLVAADALRRGAGTWTMGVPGATGEFVASPGRSVSVDDDGSTLTATTPGAALRLVVDERVRALSFDPSPEPRTRRFVLAVTRERVPPAAATVPTGVLTDLGHDRDAIDPSADGHRLFDLGLGREEVRFCLCCPPGNARDTLMEHCGQSLAAILPSIGPALLRESPVRVIESALGRLEISTPLPPPGRRSPAGPRTHLASDHLANGRAMPVGLDLPKDCLPGAIIYPRRSGARGQLTPEE